jgi:cell cycle checkpoint protein
LTGPAGTGKTTTIRVLARELGVDILEWKNPIDDNFSRNDFAGQYKALQSRPRYNVSHIDDSIGSQRDSTEYESLSEKFQSFLLRASRCQNILTAESSSTAHLVEPSTTPRSSKALSRRQIILLEDLPNILHHRTRERFHSALEMVVHSPDPNPAPIVIIVSDAGLRGEASDEMRSQGFSGSWGKEVVDIRSVLPSGLLNSMWVTQIG